ncbi:hypothetical protein PAMA_009400 [Pampus argenteus]
MIITLSMSSVWHIANFCLFFTALCGAVRSSGVEWRNVGEHVTIQCKCQSEQDSLFLKKGLKEEILYIISNRSTKSTEFKHRLQLNGSLNNTDILITNLTLNDTGLYWCEYKRFDKGTTTYKSTIDSGSVLLVVTDKNHQYTKQQCAQNNTLVLTFTVVSSAVLLVIICVLFIYIIYKTKILANFKKMEHVATSDVYEDMRATVRH